MALQSRLQQEQLKTATLTNKLSEVNVDRADGAERQRAQEEMKVQRLKMEMDAEKATVELAKSKLEFEVEYLWRTIQQQTKELEVNRLESKEYLKSCNAAFKQSTSVEANREKINMR